MKLRKYVNVNWQLVVGGWRFRSIVYRLLSIVSIGASQLESLGGNVEMRKCGNRPGLKGREKRARRARRRGD